MEALGQRRPLEEEEPPEGGTVLQARLGASYIVGMILMITIAVPWLVVTWCIIIYNYAMGSWMLLN